MNHTEILELRNIEIQKYRKTQINKLVHGFNIRLDTAEE